MSNRKETRQKWKELIELYEASDMSQKKFCEEFDLKHGTFQYWRKKFKKESLPNATEQNFIEVRPSISSSDTFSVHFLDLEVRLPLNVIETPSAISFIRSLAQS